MRSNDRPKGDRREPRRGELLRRRDGPAQQMLRRREQEDEPKRGSADAERVFEDDLQRRPPARRDLTHQTGKCPIRAGWDVYNEAT